MARFFGLISRWQKWPGELSFLVSTVFSSHLVATVGSSAARQDYD
jgi:hypothetical protein